MIVKRGVTAVIYRIYPQAGKARFFAEPYSWSNLPYCTVREMRVRYPDGNFVIIGEIGGIAQPRPLGISFLPGMERPCPSSRGVV